MWSTWATRGVEHVAVWKVVSSPVESCCVEGFCVEGCCVEGCVECVEGCEGCVGCGGLWTVEESTVLGAIGGSSWQVGRVGKSSQFPTPMKCDMSDVLLS